jgi:tetratricopeptide (TPR) repeat protein
LNSGDAQAFTGRGLSLLSLGKFSMALADFESVIKSQPQSSEALVNRGDLFQEMGRWQECADDYRAANEVTESAVACQRLAWVLATCPEKEMRDFDGALALAKKAVVLGGDTATNLDTLAACEAAKGDFDAAKATQQKVIGLVGSEEETTAEPFQARLMLYEKSEPYLQTENLESKSVGDDENKSSGLNIK